MRVLLVITITIANRPFAVPGLWLPLPTASEGSQEDVGPVRFYVHPTFSKTNAAGLTIPYPQSLLPSSPLQCFWAFGSEGLTLLRPTVVTTKAT